MSICRYLHCLLLCNEGNVGRVLLIAQLLSVSMLLTGTFLPVDHSMDF